MKRIFVALFVTIPLGMAALFIINGIVSETFPLFTGTVDQSQLLEETYEAAKERCQNNQNSEMSQPQSYDECIKMVEKWFEENPYK